jgi:hypothetical protein
MLDLDANRTLRWLFRIARVRVSLGFLVAAIAFLLADPTCLTVAVGSAVGGCGEAIRVWAAGHLRKSEEVTSSGPYRLTRHPLYLGSCIVGIGFVIAAANMVVAVAVLGYLALMFWVAITLEEATLRDKFGSTYDGYASGRLESSRRAFSLEQAVRNGEHQALLGFAASLALLSLKVWFGSVV